MKERSMNKRHYNVGLDLIRIFAMLAVISVHLLKYLPISERIVPFFTWGGAGVWCFFVLSGFLACYSFNGKIDAKTYYKKRAIRILPAYYFAVVLVIIMRQFALKDVTSDIFKLGWLRYFLGLNTILPSANYDLWNNTSGLWTMSCFIWFYIMAPIIFNCVKALKGAIKFFAFSLLASIVWKVIMYQLFSRVNGIESLNVLTGSSPFGTLFQFSIGIIAFYIIKEEKIYKGIVILSLISVCGLILKRDTLVWCSLCGLVIIAFEMMDINISDKLKKAIQMLGKESFHIYLSHLLSFAVAWRIIDGVFESSIGKYSCWMIISILLIILNCYIMRLCERIVKRTFSKS